MPHTYMHNLKSHPTLAHILSPADGCGCGVIAVIVAGLHVCQRGLQTPPPPQVRSCDTDLCAGARLATLHNSSPLHPTQQSGFSTKPFCGRGLQHSLQALSFLMTRLLYTLLFFFCVHSRRMF